MVSPQNSRNNQRSEVSEVINSGFSKDKPYFSGACEILHQLMLYPIISIGFRPSGGAPLAPGAVATAGWPASEGRLGGNGKRESAELSMGLSVDCLWFYGKPVELWWKSSLTSIVDYYGGRMDCLWIVYGLFMDYLWLWLLWMDHNIPLFKILRMMFNQNGSIIIH